MGKYAANPSSGGAGADGGEGDGEEQDVGQSSHFTVWKMLSFGIIPTFSYLQGSLQLLQFIETFIQGCGAANQQRQEDQVYSFCEGSFK